MLRIIPTIRGKAEWTGKGLVWRVLEKPYHTSGHILHCDIASPRGFFLYA